MSRLSVLRRSPLTVAATVLAATTVAATFTACGPPSLSAEAQRGQAIFMAGGATSCATCHSLLHAGAKGKLGRDLDMLRPSRAQTIQAVTHGIGIMPAQKGILSPQEIEDVAIYVAEVAGR